MNHFFQRLFLFEKYDIQTGLSKKQILNRVESFAKYEDDYYCSVSENGFFIGEKSRKHFSGGYIQNSFAPVAKAKIIEKDGITTVSMVLRMHLLVWILVVPFYILSLLTIVLFPLEWILLHFAFVKPKKRLKQLIENLLIENDEN